METMTSFSIWVARCRETVDLGTVFILANFRTTVMTLNTTVDGIGPFHMDDCLAN